MRKKNDITDFIRYNVYKLKEDPSNHQCGTMLWLLLYFGATNQEEIIKFIKEWEDAEGGDQ